MGRERYTYATKLFRWMSRTLLIMVLTGLLALFSFPACDDEPTDGDADGDGDGDCDALDPAGYGDCEMLLGWVWDGFDCVMSSGCDCAPDCDSFFDDMESCEDACGGIRPSCVSVPL